MKPYFIFNELSFLEKAELEFEFAVKNPIDYEKHVNIISDKLKLKGKSRFNSKKLPKFWGGRLNNKPKVVLFGLNPGLKKDPKKQPSDKNLRSDWKTYKRSREENFLDFKEKEKNEGFKSPYYDVLHKFFCGLFVELGPKKNIDWNFFDKNVLALNLFPYHSNKSEDFPSRFDPGQLGMVMQHLDSILEFASTQNPKICIFNGKVWKTLIIDHRLVKNPKEIRIIGNFSMYFFKLKKMNCVLFNHFLTQSRRDGVNDDILMNRIPQKIRKQYLTL